MDSAKADKLKAARKKLEEFKKHKQDVAIFPPPSESQKPQEHIEPAAEPVQQQQQQSSSVGSPSISSYFDNGQSYEIPQHGLPATQDFFGTLNQYTEPTYSAPPPQTQFYSAPEVPQAQFYTPSPEVFQPAFVQSTFQEPIQPVPAAAVAPTPAAQAVEPFQLSSDNIRMMQQQIDQQHLQFSQLKSELDFHRTTAGNLQQNTVELNRLRQEAQSHLDVVKVLVSEKSSLIDALQKSELTVKVKLEENEELQNRLNASRHRVKILETEIKNTTTKSAPDPEAEARKIDEIVALKIKEFRESNERLETERDEVKILLTQKRIELDNLQKNFDHLNTELHLANVRISQLSDGTPGADNAGQAQIALLNQELAIKQQQFAELHGIIDQVNRDKEASDNQYQNYVSHLTKEMETLKETSAELTSENDSLVKREQELLKHVADLERQIQQQIQKQKIYAEDSSSSPSSQEELLKLSSQVAALTESNETLKSQVGKLETERNEISQQFLLKDEEVKNIELQMEKLKVQTPNLSQLMTDFEDKSVTASRAMSQNQALKDQLDEMQRAFITMTNDKMELTDKLQSEMHLCKEMKVRYDAMELDLQDIREKWQFKEDEMIRLSRETTELEKKIYQQNIEIDRLRHYESKEYHGTEGILEKELENYKRRVDSLTNKISVLESKKNSTENGDAHSHDNHAHDGHSHSHDGHPHAHDGHSHSHDGHNHSQDDHGPLKESHTHLHDSPSHDHKHESPAKDHHCHSEEKTNHLLQEIEMLKMEKNELVKALQDFQKSRKTVEVEQPESGDDKKSPEVITNGGVNEKTVSVPKSVTASMATEEALEKLQARFRRTMLEVADLTEEKQRLEHVVTQLQFETETIGEYITLYQFQRRLLKQKEHERDVQLKNLAADREKMNEKLLQLNALIEKFVIQHTDDVELAREAAKFIDQSRNDESQPMIIRPDLKQEKDRLKLKQETAGKILEILSDIKTANSLTYEANVGVEHCSCCLGKLETV